MDHKDALGDFIEAGKSSTLDAAFRNVAEVTAADGVPKYSDKVLKTLARAIVCRNYAKSVLQLCHLVNAADALGRGRESYERLFFGGGRAAAASFRGHIADAVARTGWRRPGFENTGQGITIEYADGRFEVPYARMAFLCSLLDFLIADGSYGEVDEIFREMLNDASKEGAIKHASNAVSRQIYRFLGPNAASAQNMQKFWRIAEFLRERGEAGEMTVDDAAILRFWRDYSGRGQGEAGDFRAYRTVFDAFVAFVRAVGASRDRRAFDRPATIGGNREEGEIDPEVLSEALEMADQWQSPLQACDTDPANRIKFLTKTERQTIDLVMDCGPEALRLPISVLRAQTFAKTQARLTQARRNRKGGDLKALIGGKDTPSYKDCEAAHQDIAAHIHKVMQAALYVLTQAGDDAAAGNVVAMRPKDPMELYESFDDEAGASVADARTLEESESAFKAFSRKGFDDDGLDDPDIIEGFKIGAGAMAAAKRHVEAFLSVVSGLDVSAPDLTARFETDHATFSDQFQRLYGDVT